MRTIIQGCAVATVDAAGTEYADGHVVLEGNRIVAVGAGSALDVGAGDRVVDGRGCLATPGLVNTHHHLYQWATRGLATDENLFGWLSSLYPVWEGLDEDVVGAASAAGLAWLARTGCTTTADHHYVFPRDGGDVLGATIEAARQVGLRFHPTRGSMDLGASVGGLPPDSVVESTDAALAATVAAIDAHHDPSSDSMLRMGVAPCSPFSVTGDLMRNAAELARSRDVRLHTHLAETVEEEAFCREQFGCSPAEYVEELGWLGDDVWLAHCVHLDDKAIDRLGETGTGVAHCPTSNGRLGAGTARVRELRAAGVAVGLGVDGVGVQRGGLDGGRAARGARRRAGARGRIGDDRARRPRVGHHRWRSRARVVPDDLGSLEVGKLADVALWRLDGLAHAGIDDPVAALVLGSRPPLALLLVNGVPVVEDDVLLTADEATLAGKAAAAARRLADRRSR